MIADPTKKAEAGSCGSQARECMAIPEGTDRFPVWLSFDLVSKILTRDPLVLVGRLDDRCECSQGSFVGWFIRRGSAGLKPIESAV